jgi:hypothetical protein
VAVTASNPTPDRRWPQAVKATCASIDDVGSRRACGAIGPRRGIMRCVKECPALAAALAIETVTPLRSSNWEGAGVR